MVNKLLIMVLVFTSSKAFSECDVYFSTNQLHVLQKAFDSGSEEGFGWSLAAIAWRESSAGVELVRFDPPYKYDNASYGVFHNYLRTVMNREGCKNQTCAAKITQKLMTDFEYSAGHALQELKYWKKLRGNNFKEIWRGYNDGFKNRPKGYAYADDIANKIVYLKQCVRLEN